MTREKDKVMEMIENDSFLSEYKPYITIVETNPNIRNISSSKVRALLIAGKKDEAKLLLPEELHENISLFGE